MHKLGAIVLLACILLSMGADGSMIHHESLDMVLPKVALIAIVNITKAIETSRSAFHLELIFCADIEKIVTGLTGENHIICSYSQGVPHRRGDVSVAPLVTGSGLELTIQKGDQAIFLLSAEGKLLRAEPLQNLDSILKLLSQE